MNNGMISPTHQYLLDHYGPLMTLKHVAEVMHSTPNGVRMAITRHRQPFSMALAEARRQLGRRVFFEARRVAEIIERDIGEAHLSHDSNTNTENYATKQWPRKTTVGAAKAL